MDFKTIAQFIDNLKQNKNVVGIVEYGGRSYNDLSDGGDYDLTVITRKYVSKGIGGLHFHISNIPIDCMILSIDDFIEDEPKNPFLLVHLNCKILFDRDGVTKDLLKKINCKWHCNSKLTEREIGWVRFTFTHVIDKLKYRLKDDVLYSNYFMAASLDWFLECYAKIKSLEVGKPKQHFKHIKENDYELYEYFESFYKTTDVEEHFLQLKSIAQCIAKDIGGLWKEDEMIFHLESDSVSQVDKDAVLGLLFNN